MKKLFIIILITLLCVMLHVDISLAESSDNVDVSKVQVGDTILFGHYPQEFDGQDNTEISWTVYSITGKNAFLFSDKSLAIRPFDENGKTSWAKSSLRKWLNKEFLLNAFSKEEQKQLISIKHENTSDKVSLMAYKEAVAVFGGYSEYFYNIKYAEEAKEYISRLLHAQETEYAIVEAYLRWGYDTERAEKSINNKKGDLSAPWWTCSTNKNNKDQVMQVSDMFTGVQESAMAPHAEIGVRPIIQINLGKAKFNVIFRNK